MFRRRLFYLSGFDPRGARFYHALHREQVGRRAERLGLDIAVSNRKRGEGMSVDWTVDSPAEQSATRVTFLRWDDLIARAWITDNLEFARRMVAAYWRYIWRLQWLTGWRMGKGPMIAMAFPPVFALLLPLLFGLPFALALALVLPWWAAALAGLVPGVWLARRQIIKMRAFWLVRLFIHNDDSARHGLDPQLAARLDSFAQQIATALDEDDDEVLLVAHSNGSILIVPLLLRLIELRGGGPLPDRFTLVTYGQCIPLLTGRRDAGWFRTMLHDLSRQRLRWIDIGSPPDGAAFSLIDPLLPATTCGEGIDLTLLSPRFFRFFDPENYRLDYASKYDAHFDYLRCADRVSPIDFPSLSSSAVPAAQAVAAFRIIP